MRAMCFNPFFLCVKLDFDTSTLSSNFNSEKSLLQLAKNWLLQLSSLQKTVTTNQRYLKSLATNNSINQNYNFAFSRAIVFLTAVFEFELKQIGFQMFILAYFHLSLFQKYISMCLFLRSLVNYVNHPQTSL